VRSESERTLKDERDKLVQQLAFQKQEFETKIEKLQLRIKDLSSQAAAGDPSRSGFFRR
jgi:phage shock protein A